MIVAKKVSRKFVWTVSCIRCRTRLKFVLAVFTKAKSHETHQNMAFGSNKMDGHVCCEKISKKLIRTVLCIRCTTRIKFVHAVFTLTKSPEMHQNMSFGSNKVDWARLLQKNLQNVHSHTFVHPVHSLYSCFHIGKIARNASKHGFRV